MEPLHAVAYVSSAVQLPSRQVLDDLLERSRSRNALESVTGLLLYSDGNFMQYIEGPRGGIDAIFASIGRDPLHHSIIELLNDPVVSREFPGWSMAFSFVESADILGLSEAQWHEAPGPGGAPRTGIGRELLKAFWLERTR